jgi:hypothetical protein
MLGVLLLFGCILGLTQKHLLALETMPLLSDVKPLCELPKADAVGWWKPKFGLTFHIQHIKSKEEARKLPHVDVVNLELSHVQKYLGPNFFKSTHKKLVCYLSASFEDWRLDADSYPKDAIGDGMTGWNESWGNIYKHSLRDFLESRMDLARSLGCDAIEIDNTDPAFNAQEAGFNITPEQNREALIDLAGRSHKRNMAIFLKNTGDLAEELEPYFEGVFNEQCGQYNECDDFEPFVKAEKPVFQVEYHTCKPFEGHVVHRKTGYFEVDYQVCK